MKNPHGVEPTRLMKRKESEHAINCDPFCSPIFGDSDIHIYYFCDNKNSCMIKNDGYQGYECHPEYKSSLFVNTDVPDETNSFTVLDYEVFTIN